VSSWTIAPLRPGTRDDGAVTQRESERESERDSQRDDALMRSLYEQYAGSLLAFTLGLTGGDRQRAEDVVQETLVRAWRNADRLQSSGRGSLRPWLVTVARRIAIDKHRGASARPVETHDPEVDVAVPDETERLVQVLTLTDALRALSRPHREILVETYFRGCTVAEAAQALDLPLGTAKSRVFYALRALREALDERGVAR